MKFVRLPWLFSVLVIGTAVGLAFLIGPLTRAGYNTPRELVILILVLVTSTMILIPSERALKFGMIVWIITFTFGWRTLRITSTLSIHPSEALAWLLFLGAMMHQVIYRKRLELSLPIFIPCFLLLGIFGIWTATSHGTGDEAIIHEFQIFFAMLPSYYVVKWLIVTKADWERAARALVLVAVYVGGLGMLDYLAPDLSQRWSGNSGVDTTFMTTQGFARSNFVFFGSSTAAFVIFIFLGITASYFLAVPSGHRWERVLLGAALGIEFFGIYLSGFRGLYYATAVLLIAYALVHRRAWVLLGGVAAGLPFLPREFYMRLFSLVNLEFADTSQVKRFDRAAWAVELIKQSPLIGWGWGGSGYVHSDFIQIGANLGLVALAIFLGWILTMLWKLWRLTWRGGWVSQFASALFATLCGLVVAFAGEGFIYWAQFMLPVWFVFGLIGKLSDLSGQETMAIAGSIGMKENAAVI